MKLPDFTQVDEAGVIEYHGHADAIAAAANHARLRYLDADLTHAVDKASLFAALAHGLKLPEHFGNNFDALADSLEDRDWLGKTGCVDPSAARRALPEGASARLGDPRGDPGRGSRVLGRAAPRLLGARRLAAACVAGRVAAPA